MKKLLFLLPILALTACDNNKQIEKCIDDINSKVLCANDECNVLYIKHTLNEKIYYISLLPNEALTLSKNWDYPNIKMYKNDGKMEKHEKDACEVLERVNNFIANQKFPE